MLGDGLVWRLVLAADSQPNIAFISLYQPAVRVHLGRQLEEQQCREQKEEKLGVRLRGQTGCVGHGVEKEVVRLPQQKIERQQASDQYRCRSEVSRANFKWRVR